jgi:hypothetical protein
MDPTLFAGGGNNNQGYNAAAMNAIAAGHTAGIVLGLLLGLANLYVLFRLAQNARVSFSPIWTTITCFFV